MTTRTLIQQLLAQGAKMSEEHSPLGLDNFLPDGLEAVIKHKEDNVKILASPD